MKTKKNDASNSSNSLEVLNKVNGFIRIHFVRILVVIILLVLSLVVFLTVRSISLSSEQKALDRISALEERFDNYDSELTEEELSLLISDLENEIKVGTKYSSAKAAYVLGRLYFKNNDYDNAVKAFDRVISKQDDTYLAGLAYLYMAECYELSDNSLVAIETYGKAADLDVEFGIRAKAYLNMGAIAEKIGENDLAVSYMRQAAELESYSEYGKLAKNWLALH